MPRALASVVFFGAALCVATVAGAQVVSFTPGDVVVYRVGTGSSPLVATGNAVFLDEYKPDGTLVQSIPLPTAASGLNKAFVASGTATSDGLLTRSADGTCLVLPGYARDLGTGSNNLATTGTLANGNPVPRAVARVSAFGVIDTRTALTNASKGDNFRGAASTDCSSVWVSGAGTATTSGGVGFATIGGTTSTDLTAASFANVRAVAIFGGRLYTSASVTNLRGVATVGGSGVPTSGPATVTKLPGLTDNTTPSTYGFFLADLNPGVAGVDTLYVADDSTGAAGGITKFSFDGTTWAARGTIGAAADAYRGLTGVVTGTSVTLYATRNGGSTSSGGGELVKFTDSSGFNGVLAGSPTIIATAANQKAFRGVALAPAFTVTPSAGLHGTISPSSPKEVAAGASAQFIVTPDAGYTAVVSGTCGGSLAGNTFTTNAVASNCTVSAIFTLIPTFMVVPGVSPGGHGSITPNVTLTVLAGAMPSFTVVAEHGYTASVGGTCGGVFNGSIFTTNPVQFDCSVIANFTPLPRYTVTPLPGPHGVISPAAPQSVIVGETATFTIFPAAGYSAAVRGTCGGTLAGNTFTTSAVGADCTVNVVFANKLVLFVGNSFTFGRVDPVMSYNTANVTDLTYQMWLANPDGSNEDEPHPWGGIPGVFKKLTDQAGLDYDVSISARNAASLRGHLLNTNPAGWDLRGNMASQRWDTVVLQDLSDEPLPAGRGANANLPYFNAYADIGEALIHQGLARSYTETDLFGGTTALCRSTTGASSSACDAVRDIPANPLANASADVFLYETWARPDMIAPNGTNTTADGPYYSAAEGLEAMTADFHDAYFGRAAANPNFAGVSPVGDAFLRAVQDGVAMRDPYVPEAGKIDLWHTDFFHPSKYGSYLSALVQFAVLTRMNPMMFGPGEQAAADLGIAPEIAVALQRVARETVFPDTIAPTTTASASPSPNDHGWNQQPVTVTLTATDDPGGWGVDAITPSSGPISISSEGVTTLTYFATDLAGNVEPAHTLVVRVDSMPPVTGATLSSPSNAQGWHHHDVTVSLAAMDGSLGSGVDAIHYSLTGAQIGTGVLPASGAITISAEGFTTVTYFATDAAGNQEAPHTLTVAIDTTGPVISGMPAACNLWPPNHKMVSVATISVSNGGGVSPLSSFTVTASSSEPPATGESDTSITGSGAGPRVVFLRADRNGTGPGRTYTITVSATDEAGNTATASASCIVPHDKGK